MTTRNAPSPQAIARATDIFNGLECRFDDGQARAMAIITLARALDVPAVATGLVWKAEPNRIAAYSGNVAIGAIYPGDGKYVRWRCWVSCAIHQQEGAARSDTAARAEVEMRFVDFVAAADLSRREDLDHLQNKIGEAYQAVGQIMVEHELHDCPKVIALLDLLAGAEDGPASAPTTGRG